MTTHFKFLFYISENYSFEILRPLQKTIIEQGHQVVWFVEGSNIDSNQFSINDIVLSSVTEVIKYTPAAVFVPGNHVPKFMPGIKVQVFHGLEWKKKGHFNIRGWFDLYCTHGEATTTKFRELSRKHKYFMVQETGWPKLDPLFSTAPYNYRLNDSNKRLLFAPTFSPSLTSAYSLFKEISQLSETGRYNILVKFHPKMDKNAIKLYENITSKNLEIIYDQNINSLLQWADILISDTSSVIGEFSLLKKPVITLNNLNAGRYLINITEPSQLNLALIKASSPSQDYLYSLTKYADSLHPYQDGLSSSRILSATINLINKKTQNLNKKPLNIIRSIKLRKKLNYWKL